MPRTVRISQQTACTFIAATVETERAAITRQVTDIRQMSKLIANAAEQQPTVAEEINRSVVRGRGSAEESASASAGISAASGARHGLEALARWQDDELGDVPPSSFITVAEETGQTEAIGQWSLREACRQMAQWREAGAALPRVSVNLSPINFQNRDLPGYIAARLDEFALPGHRLTIEITESTSMTLTTEMLEVVQRIRALGCGLSVDDFGTGFSSLSRLANLPVTEIKIGRSFVERCVEESRLQSLIVAMVGLGHNLGMTVVAEGIETQEQRTLLGQYRSRYSRATCSPAP